MQKSHFQLCRPTECYVMRMEQAQPRHIKAFTHENDLEAYYIFGFGPLRLERPKNLIESKT